MATTLTRWRDNVFAPLETGLGPFSFVSKEIRIEQVMEDGRFVVRAEIPGSDPDKEVTVTVTRGVLKIEAERTEEAHDHAHSEFRYGRLTRAIALPAGVQEDTATAKYARGILEISLGMGDPQESSHRIPIEVAKEVDGKPRK